MKSKIFNEISLFIFAILFIILFKNFVMNKMIISGGSMANNYKNGDVVWVEKISCKYKINRFDVVVIDNKKGNIIKRIIGLANEIVQIKSGIVYINDEKLKSDYEYYIIQSGVAAVSFKLGNHEYFVMGDNQNNSSDSRDFGAVEGYKIIGKPFFRYFPLNRIGKVE